MKRIIKIFFFIMVEIWFVFVLLMLCLPISFWEPVCFSPELNYSIANLFKWFFSHLHYFWMTLYSLAIPVYFYSRSETTKRGWVLIYYQLIIFAPVVLLIGSFASET